MTAAGGVAPRPTLASGESAPVGTRRRHPCSRDVNPPQEDQATEGLGKGSSKAPKQAGSWCWPCDGQTPQQGGKLPNPGGRRGG